MMERVLDAIGAELSPEQLARLEQTLRETAALYRMVEARGGTIFTQDLNICADRTIRYKVLYQVLECAVRAGFRLPKLVVWGY